MNACMKCSLCSCCCVLVLVAIAIPVFIFAVLPGLAQKSMDQTAFALANSTMLPCDNFNSQPYRSELINTVSVKSVSPLSLTMEPVLTTLTTYVCEKDGSITGGYSCANPVPAELGTFTPPSAILKKGDNSIMQHMTLAVTNQTTVMTGFIFPILMGHKARLTLEAKDASVKMLGMLTIHKLNLKKDLTCSLLGGGLPPNPVTSKEYCPDSKSVTGIEMTCVEAGDHTADHNSTTEEVRTSDDSVTIVHL
eukprot:gnl/MRDRNA2_/MRDRNA2_129242_c0_seq1.p1 gnl/MRDRNA2_/MRDRNA2_129242_c0~~gnl/MRDRNA2_/MRDRNA2_129242_c0_seq1.p1  ORF type:complete len:250 (-),score=32.93 gnl/MRDRNA2_/MRDRNA2_129242_c0_seq1:39-788(-)